MAFDPSNYKVASTASRFMPVVLLLDVSSSMSGDKINNLYDATTKMIETFAEQRKEIPYKVAIITFGDRVECVARYTDASALNNLPRFDADGMTPLGVALRMAKDMIEDKNETSLRWFSPAVVLVSDGYPNDDYQGPLNDFINNGRTSRCQRLSMGIGNDADYDMLRYFASDDTEGISGSDKFCFKAENAGNIVAVFKLITTSIVSSVVKNRTGIPQGNKTASKKSSTNFNEEIYV